MQNIDDLMYNDAFEKHSISIERLEDGEQRNTYTDWKLIALKKPLVSPARPKVNYAESEATDGSHDMTEVSADRVLYNDREGSWSYHWIDVPYTDPERKWDALLSQIQNFLQGKRVKVSINDDSNYYWVGRLWVEDVTTESHRATVAIHYQFEPYKYEWEEYESELVTTPTNMTIGGNTVKIPVGFNFNGSEMPTTPIVESLSTRKYYYPKQQMTRGLAVLLIYNSVPKINSARSLNISTDITIASSQFLDVDEEADYYNAILWAEGMDWISGYTENIFAPNNGITRAQFYTILWKVMGMPTGSGKAAFTDVKRNSYYYKSVQWAFSIGLAVGDGNGHFMPDAVITREQAMFVIWKLCGSPSSSSVVITDVKNGELIKPWYYDACKKLKAEGIISGGTDNMFRAGNAMKRIHLVTLLWIMYDSPHMESITLPFNDLGNCTEDQILALKWMYSMDWISGTASNKFSPERAVYRKEAIQWIYEFGNYIAYNDRVDHYTDLEYVEDDDPEADWVGDGYDTPSDVSVSAYYYHAVCWGVLNEVTTLDKGYKFNPDDVLTRGMAVQMLYKVWCRWTKTYPEYTTAGTVFNDVVCYVLNYATAVYWGYNQGILDDAFIHKAHMHLVIQNKYGIFRADVPYGTFEVPELLIAEGENTVAPTNCEGQYRIRFKRGSL